MTVAPSEKRLGKDPWWIQAGLVLLVAAVYGRCVGHEFINYDDNYYVINNPVVNDGLTWRGVWWAFSGGHEGNWHPLTWLSHMLDCTLFGLMPWWHHLHNLLLHAVSSVLLYRVLVRLTGLTMRSAFVAAVFAVHPLHVESVAWVAERKDVLSGLFFILTLGAYLDWVRRPGGWRYGRILAFYALGLMSKPTLVTLPFVLLLLDYWPLGRMSWKGWRSRVGEKLPLIVMSGIICGVTLITQHEEGAIKSTENFSIGLRLSNAVVSYVLYIIQSVWPVGLSVHYALPKTYPFGEIALSATVLVAISAWVWRQRMKEPYLLMGWCWFVGILVPMIGLVQVGLQARADRYLYLSQTGLVLAVVWWLGERMQRFPQWRRPGVYGGCLILALLSGVAFRQAGFWKDPLTLFTHVAEVTERNDLAELQLASEWFNQGRYEECERHLLIALDYHPDYASAENLLGSVYYKVGRVEEALKRYEHVLSYRTDYYSAHNNYGYLLYRLGRLDEAEKSINRALELKPKFIEALCNRGLVLLEKRRPDEAIQSYQEALRLNHKFADAYQGLGAAAWQKGDAAQAEQYLLHALQLRPIYGEASYALGILYGTQHRPDLAARQFRRVVEFEPRFLSARNQLAWILSTSSDSSLRNGTEAVALAEKTNEMAGGQDPAFLCTLAAAYAECGRFKEAGEKGRQAMKLAGDQKNTGLIPVLENHLKAYLAQKPIRT